MKKVGLTITTAIITVMATTAMAVVPARPVTTMDAVETAGHVIIAKLKSKQIDPLFGTDITSLSISANGNGYAVEVIAPSADPSAPNKISMIIDATAKVKSFNQTLISKNPNGALFTTVDAGTIIDFAAEAIVDHLLDVPANPDLAPVSQGVVSEELSLEASGPRVRVNLKDGRAYLIQMDKNGLVLTQGF